MEPDIRAHRIRKSADEKVRPLRIISATPMEAKQVLKNRSKIDKDSWMYTMFHIKVPTILSGNLAEIEKKINTIVVWTNLNF